MNDNIEEIIQESITNEELLGIKFKYNREANFYYSINQNDEFYYGVEEYDFLLDSYQIRKKADIVDLQIINNFSSKINVNEGLINKIERTNIDLTSFQTIFNDLMYLDRIISIEREFDDEDNFFVIGKILEVTEDSVMFKDFSIEGIWNDEVNIIPYDLITTIRFNSRYINTWSKYMIGEEDEN